MYARCTQERATSYQYFFTHNKWKANSDTYTAILGEIAVILLWHATVTITNYVMS